METSALLLANYSLPGSGMCYSTTRGRRCSVLRLLQQLSLGDSPVCRAEYLFTTGLLFDFLKEVATSNLWFSAFYSEIRTVYTCNYNILCRHYL